LLGDADFKLLLVYVDPKCQQFWSLAHKSHENELTFPSFRGREKLTSTPTEKLKFLLRIASLFWTTNEVVAKIWVAGIPFLAGAAISAFTSKSLTI
jgi:hypothetical protein